MNKLRTLDIFSGIGGFSLGLERTQGFQTVAFCEIDPFCRRVLNKHWPEVPIYEDVRSLTADALARDGIAVDVICGGFPCTDISWAGNGAGIAGEQSGLWEQYARLIGEIRPRFVIVENVAALLARGMGQVLGDLAALGLDAEWHCIPASVVGLPHERDRIWIIAHSAEIAGICRLLQSGLSAFPDRVSDWRAWARERWGDASPLVRRANDGIPERVGRVEALGNAVVPEIPELIGRAILASEARP